MKKLTTKFFVYVTKYALTKGIEKREVRDCFDISPTMVASDGHFSDHYHGDDWHRTYECAHEEVILLRRQLHNAGVAS